MKKRLATELDRGCKEGRRAGQEGYGERGWRVQDQEEKTKTFHVSKGKNRLGESKLATNQLEKPRRSKGAIGDLSRERKGEVGESRSHIRRPKKKAKHSEESGSADKKQKNTVHRDGSGVVHPRI